MPKWLAGQVVFGGLGRRGQKWNGARPIIVPCYASRDLVEILEDLVECLLDLIKIRLEPRKMLLVPAALASFCEVQVECLLDLLKIVSGLAEFLLGFTMHNKSR